ncbi:hypothetical protein PVAP13_9NG116673 [Panicum virgatum]|uniref:Uncharacterized protein n=1 Tax=Panicum virgatum TaxID=38727 RepID=A0A8T0MGN9_PANVG|nr:hypothetical protein PVAP13_9NG116673 [Panicum virgatum]
MLEMVVGLGAWAPRALGARGDGADRDARASRFVAGGGQEQGGAVPSMRRGREHRRADRRIARSPARPPSSLGAPGRRIRRWIGRSRRRRIGWLSAVDREMDLGAHAKHLGV